jgi:acyl-homoserine lactone acylase PvdQ
MIKTLAVIAAVAGLAFSAPAALAAKGPIDYSQTALSIIPSGQADPGETLLPGVLPNDTQAKMYNALTPLFNHVTNADLFKDFKSEKFGTAGQCPCVNEPVPYKGVTLIRDKYDVPHVTATTHAGGVWAAGWIAAEDRGLLLSEARYDSLVAAIDAPNLSAIGLIENLDSFTPSAQTERVVSRQTQVLVKAGPEGRDVLRDIDTFVTGINAYNAIHNPGEAKFTRNDIYAFNALKDQFFGEGGGNQAQNSEFLSGLESRLGANKGYSVFDDLRQNLNAGAPTTVDGTFNYNHDPSKPGSPGSVLVKPGSFQSVSYATTKVTGDLGSLEPRPHASNELMVEAKYSATGHPLLVGGPQVGYFYPGLTYEIDMHAPGLDWRGATSAPFPGYMLIGRGPDFATTLTSAGADDTDEFAETLCGGSQTKYIYDGKCRAMQRFDAGTVTTSKGTSFAVKFWTTVNGPVIGYATVKGQPVALAQKRTSTGKDVDDLLFYYELAHGKVHNVKQFFAAAAKTPQTFNSLYVNDKDIAVYTSGLVPIQPSNVDQDLPVNGDGTEEWRGFVSAKNHPQGINPPSGEIVNWNNRTEAGYEAPDDNWSLGAVQRVSLLIKNLGTGSDLTPADVVSAMNKAATQDVDEVTLEPLLAQVLDKVKAPSRRDSKMLQLLNEWYAHGSSLLDRTDKSGMGNVSSPGAAILLTAWPELADAWASSVLGPNLTQQFNSLVPDDNPPPDGQYTGWYVYMDKDLRTILGQPVKGRFSVKFCGGGNVKTCARQLWSALDTAGNQLQSTQGPNPSNWRVSAVPQRITFTPGLLSYTMRYTNRPSGIQQVISFSGHAPGDQ